VRGLRFIALSDLNRSLGTIAWYRFLFILCFSNVSVLHL